MGSQGKTEKRYQITTIVYGNYLIYLISRAVMVREERQGLKESWYDII